MDDPTSSTNSNADTSAHPFKRRKFYRRRAASGEDDISPAPQPSRNTDLELLTLDELVSQNAKSVDPINEEVEDDELPVAEILRRRKAALRRRGGIEFTNSAVSAGSKLPSPPGSDAILENEDDLDKILTVVDRFAPQTGQVADVDKHMMAYIDSELAKRRQGHDRINYLSNEQELSELSLQGGSKDVALHRQPAALGKLHEIDLGPDSTLRNIARTEAAKKRLENGAPEVEEGAGKLRRRRDGKPWRGRKRRNSDDIKRDKLVEEVMKESRLEIYDEPDVNLPNDDQAADDRIAEQFRREFMDAITSRRQRSTQTSKKAPGAKADDKPRGPKLGGSRSARAAMREQQEKAAKK
ncbi:MAG: hypothetical protein Q9167_006841 [Letrouitia subvulpina]